MTPQHQISLESMISQLCSENMPLFSETSKRIINLSLRDNSSLTDLSWAVLKDSSLTARVLKLANSLFFNRDGRKVSTISRAVLQLGFKTVKGICISSLLVETWLIGHKRDLVVREMVRSFHAAVQARSLAAARNDSATEEIYIATLLYRVGYVAFWCFGGEYADGLEKAIKDNPGDPQEKLEREVLGFSLQDLTIGLVKQWSLGELLEKSVLQSNTDPRGRNISISHGIARGAEQGWNSPKMEQAIVAASKLVGLSIEETTNLVKHNTEEAARIACDYGLGAYTRLVPVPSEEAKKVSTCEAVEEEFSEPNQMIQSEVLVELNSLSKDKDFNVNLFLTTLIEGISRGVGMDRVIFAVMSSDKRRLVGRYGLGWDQSMIERFEVSSKPAIPNVFGVVVSEKGPLWVNGAKSTAAYITDEVKARMTTDSFFIAPIMVRNSVIGVICADRSLSSRDLDETNFNCFTFFVHRANAILSSTL